MRRSFFADLYARRDFNNRMAEPRAVLGLCRLPAGKPCFKPYLRGISPVFISLHRDISRCDPPRLPARRVRVKARKETLSPMKMKRLVSSALALILLVSLPVSALAADWYLEDGDITVSADSSGQTVSQGGTSVADDAPVIKQRDSSAATDSTITISTSGDATANVTIEEVNISSGDSIDVGSSSANITLNGDNKLSSESGSGMHVSDGDVTITGSGSLKAESKGDNNNNAAIGSHENEDMSGDITIGGDAQVTAESGRNGAGIGSGDDGEMTGDITIGGSAKVSAKSGNDGAGIGSGDDGEMTGSITVGGSSQVTAISGNDGAGIGSGEESNMSGNITIGDNARVTAWSEDRGAGIGSGREGKVSGSITIGDNAQVSAGSDRDGAGIGGGKKGSITFTGRIIIRGNAKVTAVGEDEGTGIGPGEDKKMKGLIIIQDNAQVTVIAGDCAAAIGSDDGYEMTGTIIIIGNARVTTGVLDDDDVYFDYKTKEIKYTLDEGYIGYIGYIGDSQNSNHESGNGHYIIGPDVTINGLSGSDIEALKDYINMRLSGENNDGEPENLTKLDISSENGEFTVTAEGEGTVEKILYGGSETVPTAPGTYPVTCVVRLDDETIEFQIGTFVVPEPKSPAEAVQSAPLYRVTDKDGVDIAYKAEKNDGVLTITADEDHAVLTGTLAGIEQLKAQGVEKIVFVTNGASSAFSLNDLLEKGEIGETYKLTHDGKTVTFTLGEKMTDISLAYR